MCYHIPLLVTFFLKEEFSFRIYLYLLYRVLAIDFKIIYKLDPCAIEVLSKILLLFSVATCHWGCLAINYKLVFHWSSKLDTPLFFSYNIAKLIYNFQYCIPLEFKIRYSSFFSVITLPNWGRLAMIQKLVFSICHIQIRCSSFKCQNLFPFFSKDLKKSNVVLGVSYKFTSSNSVVF